MSTPTGTALPASRLATQHVLVVDDNPVNCDLLLRRLKRMGLERVDCVDNGEAALALLRAHPYDLVLLDVMMPVMNGYGVLMALRSEGQLPELPVLMVSATDEMSGVIRCIELGAQDYLTKPLNPQLLEARVRATLERKHLRDLMASQLERTQRDLLAARRLQLAMVPPDRLEPGAHGPLCVAARLTPAREIGGDLIDHFPLTDGHYLLALGDVSGKGAEAALCMARTVSLLRATAHPHWQNGHDAAHTVAATLADTNAALAEANESAQFVTLFLAIADLHGNRLSYACAGHPAPYLQTTGTVQALAVSPSLPLGVMPAYRARVETIDVPPGASLLAYSDGVTEALHVDGTLFGDARLAQLLGTCSSMAPQHVVAAVADGIHDFAAGAEQSDDIALLAWTRL